MKKKNKILIMLEDAAAQSGIKVIYENREPVEGICKVKGMFYLVFNKMSSFERQIEFYRTVFRKVDTENTYLPPVIREIIEKGSI